MKSNRQKALYIGLGLLFLGLLLYVVRVPAMTSIGEWIVRDEPAVKSDAAVVLNTGVEFYPRLIQAADLYRKGLVNTVVINGNRKTREMRQLERKGFLPCCPWYENAIRILLLLGVPRDRVITVDAEDACDTISEAAAVGKKIIARGIETVIIVTSKYHTRRAGFIWKRLYQGRLTVRTVAAETDPYSPEGWWKSGRQTRWVMAEYGAWVYYYWKKLQHTV
jgi:uncharacterized SAM-binding protein YcdF (DUF218 family)